MAKPRATKKVIHGTTAQVGKDQVAPSSLAAPGLYGNFPSYSRYPPR
ncbi:hypothetical protein KCMC57_up62740 [Kitasatospora sp. CMC57]